MKHGHRLIDFTLIVGPIIGIIAVITIGMGWYLNSTYDLVISGGRVVTDDNEFAVRYIGIDGGKIKIISDAPLLGRREINARGLIVGPGFIDSTARRRTKDAQVSALKSGVTTIFDHSVGAGNIAQFIEREGKPLLNIAVGIRSVALKPQVDLSPSDYSEWMRRVTSEVNAGGTSIIWDVPTSLPKASAEWLPLASIAGSYHIPVAINLPLIQSQEELSQYLDMIFETILSTKLTVIFQTPFPMTHVFSRYLVNRINHDGVSTAFLTYYPYSGEVIDAKVLNYPFDRVIEGGAQIYSLQSGERVEIKKTTLLKGRPLIVMPISRRLLSEVLVDPHALVGSGSNLDDPTVRHPKVSGTFARIINLWVGNRNRESLSWGDAFYLLSTKPAALMQTTIPGLANKGKIVEGADADLVVVSAKSVEDWATYQMPFEDSKGVVHVVVNGKWVIRNGALSSSVVPGRYLMGVHSTR